MKGWEDDHVLRDNLRVVAEKMAQRVGELLQTKGCPNQDLQSAYEGYMEAKRNLEMYMASVSKELAEKGSRPIRCDYCGINNWVLVVGRDELTTLGQCKSCNNIQDVGFDD